VSAWIAKVFAGLNPRRLTGPVLDKELRVSSRQRRNYALRVAYVALLMAFLALIWVRVLDWDADYGGAAYQLSRMAEAGKAITLVIVWFQFVAAQLVALVLTSNAISEEISRRTLGVLMSTPVTGLQIVAGKLASKFWQVLVLLAVSLPLLAVVRVLGGVPWSFVVAGLCLTLTGAVFVASLTMLLSILNRRTYAVLIESVLALGVLWAGLPLLAGWILARSPFLNERQIINVLSHANPPLALIVRTEEMMNPWWASRLPTSTLAMCAIPLGASAVVLGVCVMLVRRVALRQAAGDARPSRRALRAATTSAAEAPQAAGAPRARLRAVHGSPVLWRELRCPTFPSRTRRILVTAVVAVGLAALYFGLAAEDELSDIDTHIGFCVVFVLVGVLCTAVFAATGIAAEKESGTLPLLLATPLGDWHIVLAKMAGALRRAAPVWALLAFHACAFVLGGVLGPSALPHLGIIAAWSAAFLACSGVYFSAACRRTTTAVVWNVGLAVALWAVVPLLLALAHFGARHWEVVELDLAANPVVQTVVVVDAYRGRYYASRYSGLGPMDPKPFEWPHGRETVGATTRILLVTGCAHLLAGWLFLSAARRRLRRGLR